jgi:wyosine [tRNA(Phe)-imidazoG37] synthetase (radical SAM superfamily)
MPDEKSHVTLRLAHQSHERRWEDFAYCYPVISRRSKGLSIGVNLNPDKACNFDCIYCQVDRTVLPVIRKVDLSVVAAELDALIASALDGRLWQAPPFDVMPEDQRVIRDIAFSGDGEPTTYPAFADAVEVSAAARQRHGLTDTKLVLITDACYLTKPEVCRGLAIMDENNGEVWAKLDAGTEDYYQRVNRPNYPLAHVVANITNAARVRPVVIQSLWMRVRGEPPSAREVEAFCDRLMDIQNAGGQLKLVQVYTIARRTTEAYATALTAVELARVAEVVRRRLTLPVETYPGVCS